MPDNNTSFYTAPSLRRKNIWLIKLRWLAVVATAIMIISGHFLLYDPAIYFPLFQLLFLVIVLAIVNLLYWVYCRKVTPGILQTEMRFVSVQIYLDLILLSFMIHYSGGIENPLYLFFIFHVIIASTIFENPANPFKVASLSVILMTIMVLAEYNGWVHHYAFFNTTFSALSIFLSLGVFYITMFASAYLGVTLMSRHLKVKNLISEKNKALEEAAKSRIKFFRFVSHELKSPIVAIQSSINVVLDLFTDDLPNKAQNMLHRARNRSIQMMEILKDLLELAYEQKSSENRTEKVIPCDYLKEFIDNEKPHADEKGVIIIESICSERGTLKLDKFVLEKIFSNLLSNAIRYTPAGGSVIINTKLDEHYWSFSIKDTGIGISELDKKHIFEEFYRAQNAKTHESVGTGLGLSIVKKMTEQLNGEIIVDSVLKKGTEITVRIPLK